MLVQTGFFLKESAPVPLARKTNATASNLVVSVKKRGANERSLWKNSTARYLLVQSGFLSFGFLIYISSISLFAVIKLGLSAQELGMFLAITGLAQIILRFAAFSPMLKKIGEKRTAAIGLLGYAIAYMAMGLVFEPIGLFIVLLGVTFGSVCSRGILSGFLSRSVPPEDQGKIQGVSSSIDSLAQIFGPIIGTSILTALPLFVFGMVPSLLSLIAFFMIFKKVAFQQPLTEGAKHATPQPTSMESVPRRVIAMKDGCVEHAEYSKACEK